MSRFHYTACGLDNVFIEGSREGFGIDDEGMMTISAVGLLHKVIAEGIVMHPAKMSCQELRFLRTEMGLTQAQLGKILKVRLLTVSRWERNETLVSDAAEMLVRLLAVDRLGLEVDLDVQSVSEMVTNAALVREIRIDGNGLGNCRLADAA